MVGKVMFHSTGFHHAAGRNDNARFMSNIQHFTFSNRLNIVQAVEAEGVGVRLAILDNVVVKALAMEAHNICS